MKKRNPALGIDPAKGLRVGLLSGKGGGMLRMEGRADFLKHDVRSHGAGSRGIVECIHGGWSRLGESVPA
jgi:hypothetical protein